jgi:hypothetical protein
VRALADTDVQMLASLAEALQADYLSRADAIWTGSPFAWIRTRPSRQRGAIGEQLVAGWSAAKGADVLRSPDSEADRIINGKRVEIKFSTLWESGVYKFQQIRDQRYDHLVCLGVSPFDAQCWVLPKDVLKLHVIGHMGQHLGAAGTDTSWLSFRPTSPYPWMARFGGQLADAWQIIDLWRPTSD